MNFIDNFFVFPQAVNIEGELKCNIDPDRYTVYFRNISHVINLTDIPENSTTVLLYDHQSESFLQVNAWEELVSKAVVTSQQALRILQRASFVQIDYYHGKYFTKVFLPVNQLVLNSDTHDFTLYSCFPINYLHPVDWHYSITADVIEAVIHDKTLSMIIEVVPSVLSDSEMYLSHGSETVKLVVGKNTISLPYVQGELIHFGHKPHYKGMGNSLKVEDYL